MASESSFTNQLIYEKNPYLLQHAHNPVNWYPWGHEALAKAQSEFKVIFLSIGYSTCHWCHVMEKESFENETIARILNEFYIAIKIDREERPDLDQIYMNAVMLLTGQGGWPISLWLTPDLTPFWGGTYFPPETRYGRTGFKELLLGIHKSWMNHRNELIQSGMTIFNQVRESLSKPQISSGKIDVAWETQVVETLKKEADFIYGGFGYSIKFPQPTRISFLLRFYQKNKDAWILTWLNQTLNQMAEGGIYDHLEGGFSRYSTDRYWQIPHFEKMLYDNALLAQVYLEGFQLTQNSEYRRVASEILDYLLNKLRDPTLGGFFSAEDADSEGVEGKFYTWNLDDFYNELNPEDAQKWIELFNVTPSGNFDGKNVLFLKSPLFQQLQKINKDWKWFEQCRTDLIRARAKRIRPRLDYKILTAWNSLAISALAIGYRVLGDRKYLEAARSASDFILNYLKKDNRLYASYCQGSVKTKAFIDDYAFFQKSQLDLFESTFEIQYLKEAVFLKHEMDHLFGDASTGAFYFTGIDQEDPHLLIRWKEGWDQAIPSGNSIAALNLYRLSVWCAQDDFRKQADHILEYFQDSLATQGEHFTQMLQAYQWISSPPSEVVVVASMVPSAILQALWKKFMPYQMIFSGTPEVIQTITNDIPWMEGKHQMVGKDTVYICQNYHCQKPMTDLNEVFKKIGD